MLGGLIQFALKPECQIDEQDQRRNFNERSDNASECLTGIHLLASVDAAPSVH